MAGRIEASAPAARERAICLAYVPALQRPGSPPRSRKKRRKEDLAVEESVREVLALAQTNRPKNTTKAYVPKQREWKVSSPPQSFPIPFICLFIHVVLLLIYKYIQAWCERMAFRPGGEYLPFD